MRGLKLVLIQNVFASVHEDCRRRVSETVKEVLFNEAVVSQGKQVADGLVSNLLQVCPPSMYESVLDLLNRQIDIAESSSLIRLVIVERALEALKQEGSDWRSVTDELERRLGDQVLLHKLSTMDVGDIREIILLLGVGLTDVGNIESQIAAALVDDSEAPSESMEKLFKRNLVRKYTELAENLVSARVSIYALLFGDPPRVRETANEWLRTSQMIRELRSKVAGLNQEGSFQDEIETYLNTLLNSPYRTEYTLAKRLSKNVEANVRQRKTRNFAIADRLSDALSVGAGFIDRIKDTQDAFESIIDAETWSSAVGDAFATELLKALIRVRVELITGFGVDVANQIFPLLEKRVERISRLFMTNPEIGSPDPCPVVKYLILEEPIEDDSYEGESVSDMYMEFVDRTVQRFNAEIERVENRQDALSLVKSYLTAIESAFRLGASGFPELKSLRSWLDSQYSKNFPGMKAFIDALPDTDDFGASEDIKDRLFKRPQEFVRVEKEIESSRDECLYWQYQLPLLEAVVREVVAPSQFRMIDRLLIQDIQTQPITVNVVHEFAKQMYQTRLAALACRIACGSQSDVEEFYRIALNGDLALLRRERPEDYSSVKEVFISTHSTVKKLIESAWDARKPFLNRVFGAGNNHRFSVFVQNDRDGKNRELLSEVGLVIQEDGPQLIVRM
jgi:hypothetical protein